MEQRFPGAAVEVIDAARRPVANQKVAQRNLKFTRLARCGGEIGKEAAFGPRFGALRSHRLAANQMRGAALDVAIRVTCQFLLRQRLFRGRGVSAALRYNRAVRLCLVADLGRDIRVDVLPRQDGSLAFLIGGDVVRRGSSRSAAGSSVTPTGLRAAAKSAAIWVKSV